MDELTDLYIKIVCAIYAMIKRTSRVTTVYDDKDNTTRTLIDCIILQYAQLGLCCVKINSIKLNIQLNIIEMHTLGCLQSGIIENLCSIILLIVLTLAIAHFQQFHFTCNAIPKQAES